MKKKIIAISLFVWFSLLANTGLNDLELIGQNVLKNSAEIKEIKIELEEIKQKLSITNTGLKKGDQISQIDSSANSKIKEKTQIIKSDRMLFKANKPTYVRNSPSIYSSIVSKVQKGQILKKVVFESKYKIDSWIFVGNGFIMKSEFSEVDNEN